MCGGVALMNPGLCCSQITPAKPAVAGALLALGCRFRYAMDSCGGVCRADVDDYCSLARQVALSGRLDVMWGITVAWCAIVNPQHGVKRLEGVSCQPAVSRCCRTVTTKALGWLATGNWCGVRPVRVQGWLPALSSGAAQLGHPCSKAGSPRL